MRQHLSLIFLLLVLTMLAGHVSSQTSTPDLVVDIMEEQDIGVRIGSVTDNEILFRNLTDAQKRQLRYGILDQNSYPASLFRVDDTTGEIFVAKRIDRESNACYRNPQCRLEFNIAISLSRIVSNIATVAVNVADKNDNPPYFPAQSSGRVIMEMSEFATAGAALKLSGAADRDYDSNNTVQRYALTAHTDTFSIKDSHNLDGSSVLDLTLLHALDREVTSTYSFAILAYDGGSPPLSAALTVEIHVTDENDNSPVFRNRSYTVELRDEVTVGQVIVQVSASDLDEGANGKVRYQFSNLQRELLERRFRVNEQTGEITAVSSLPTGVQQFIVEAVDGGNPPLKSQTVVTVKVISSKNNPPFIQINTLSNGTNAHVEIPEDSGPGSFVAFVVAEDPDDGPQGEVRCQLHGDILRLDTLAGKGYTLTLQGVVDRETQDTYNVTVMCSDSGEPPMSSTKSLLVVITDINDNPPVFTQQAQYSHAIPEGNYTERYILQVTAIDPDAGRNAQVTYSIEDSVNPPFRIDPYNGIISVRGKLDREVSPVINLKVYAADHGQHPQTGTADVRISLQDVNDQFPTFNQSIFEYRIPEDTPVRTILGHLVAYDMDEGLNGVFEFYYAGSADGADPFVVESNGTIWISELLDRESRDSYSFTVMVRDKGLPPKTNYASVVVTVLDVNDNDPLIQFPVSGNHTIQVTTIPESGMVLAKVVAYDADAAENGSLLFTVLSGNEDGALDIDPSRGEIKVRDMSRLKNKNAYKLVIRVQDYGVPQRGTNTTIVVEINYDNTTAVLLQQQRDRNRNSDDYVIIVAGVAGTTVVLSAIIIVAICFIFRQDRKYRTKPGAASNEAGVKDDGEFFRNMSVPENLSDDEKLRPSVDEEGDNNCKPQKESKEHLYENEPYHVDHFRRLHKEPPGYGVRGSLRKKEVTFAGSPCRDDEEDVPDLVFRSEAGSPPGYRNAGGFGGEFGAGAGEYSNFKPGHGFVVKQVDEAGSDTSGETASDSGRGGSEDDVNIEHILHGDHDRLRLASPASVSSNNHGHSHIRFPPPGGHRRDAHKPFHVRFNTSTSSSPSQSRGSFSANHKSVSFSTPTVRDSPVFGPTKSSETSFSSPNFRDISFPSLGQQEQNPRVLSTFSSPARPVSFTFQKRGNSAASVDDDASTTTSGSYTVNPEEIRMDNYIGSDVIV